MPTEPLSETLPAAGPAGHEERPDPGLHSHRLHQKPGLPRRQRSRVPRRKCRAEVIVRHRDSNITVEPHRNPVLAEHRRERFDLDVAERHRRNARAGEARPRHGGSHTGVFPECRRGRPAGAGALSEVAGRLQMVEGRENLLCRIDLAESVEDRLDVMRAVEHGRPAPRTAPGRSRTPSPGVV